MTATRQDVVEEALRWEGTPYHHRARVLQVGVDCAQLPAAVYEAAGLIEPLDPDYSPQWYMHRDEELFLAYITPHATEITPDLLGPGDLCVWRFGRTFSHAAIVLNPPVVIHATLEAGAVVRSDMMNEAQLLDRPMRCFTMWPSDGR